MISMSKKMYSLAAAALMVLLPAHAAEDPAAAGKKIAGACAACHGANGVAPQAAWPNLAGQNASYVAGQLAAFKSGERKNPLMSSQAANLSEADMSNLGAYFASLPARVGGADPAQVKVAEALYRGGNAERGITACIACHGPAGKGVDSAGFPALAGQQETYTATALKAFRDGSRGNPKNVQASMMHDVAKRLTDEEITALSSYVSGLH